MPLFGAEDDERTQCRMVGAAVSSSCGGGLFLVLLVCGSVNVSRQWMPEFDDEAKKTWVSGDCRVLSREMSRYKNYNSRNQYYQMRIWVERLNQRAGDSVVNVRMDNASALKYPHMVRNKNIRGDGTDTWFESEDEAKRFRKKYEDGELVTCFWDPNELWIREPKRRRSHAHGDDRDDHRQRKVKRRARLALERRRVTADRVLLGNLARGALIRDRRLERGGARCASSVDRVLASLERVCGATAGALVRDRRLGALDALLLQLPVDRVFAALDTRHRGARASP